MRPSLFREGRNRRKPNIFGGGQTARAVIEQVLGAALEAHESEYRGGDYFRLEKDGAKLVLQATFLEDDQRRPSPDRPWDVHADAIRSELDQQAPCNGREIPTRQKGAEYVQPLNPLVDGELSNASALCRV